MKKRIFSFSMVVCIACMLTMISCGAAEVPAGGGADLDSAKLASESQPASAFMDVPARGMPKRWNTAVKTTS